MTVLKRFVVEGIARLIGLKSRLSKWCDPDQPAVPDRDERDVQPETQHQRDRIVEAPGRRAGQRALLPEPGSQAPLALDVPDDDAGLMVTDLSNDPTPVATAADPTPVATAADPAQAARAAGPPPAAPAAAAPPPTPAVGEATAAPLAAPAHTPGEGSPAPDDTPPQARA